MKKFKVTVYEVHSFEVEVEANSPEEAKEKANDLLVDIAPDVEYDHTLDLDKWPTPIEIK